MANPQIEDGHIDIANNIGDVLAQTYFSPAESKILWAILRKTYGWHKKLDKISYSQFEELTGLHSRHIGPAIKRLVKRNIIICSNSGERKISEYGLQKDYDKWELTPIQVTESDTDLSNRTDTDLSKHKNNNTITKANIYTLPDWINKNTWDSFLEMRKSIKKPATEKAIVLIIKTLSLLKESGDNPNEVLEKSIINNWRDVYPLKKQFGGQYAADTKQSTRELPKRYTTPDEWRKLNRSDSDEPDTSQE
jgi:phage replication O-like protein O